MTTLRKIIESISNDSVTNIIDRLKGGRNGALSYSIKLCSGIHDPKETKDLSSEERLNLNHSDNCNGLFISQVHGNKHFCDSCSRYIGTYGFVPLQKTPPTIKGRNNHNKRKKTNIFFT